MTDNIDFIWDKFIQDDTLTARIYRGNKFLGRGFITDADALNMQLSWSNANGFFDKLIDMISTNTENARNDITTFSNLLSTATFGKISNPLQTDLQTEMSSSELYQSFKGYQFKVAPSVEVYFISDSDDSDARGKCKTFLSEFLPAKTNWGNSNNLIWFVDSNASSQKIQFNSDGISVRNGFTLVIGGNNTNNTKGSLASAGSGNGQRVYSNLVVEGIEVKKSITTVKLKSGYAPLYFKVDLTFTPIATLAPNKFKDMI